MIGVATTVNIRRRALSAISSRLTSSARRSLLTASTFTTQTTHTSAHTPSLHPARNNTPTNSNTARQSLLKTPGCRIGPFRIRNVTYRSFSSSAAEHIIFSEDEDDTNYLWTDDEDEDADIDKDQRREEQQKQRTLQKYEELLRAKLLKRGPNNPFKYQELVRMVRWDSKHRNSGLKMYFQSPKHWLRSIPHVAKLIREGKGPSTQYFVLPADELVKTMSSTETETRTPSNVRSDNDDTIILDDTIPTRSDRLEDNDNDLDQLTVVELRRELRARGIKPGNLRKGVLIELLKENETTNRNRQEAEADEKPKPPKYPFMNKTTDNQKVYLDTLESNIPIVIVDGPAGTGKTALACAWAAKALLSGKVRRIVVTRPSVAAGESLGYLPGDLEGKLRPYLLPIYDSLSDVGVSKKQLNLMMREGAIEVAPLSFMRGRTFQHCCIVADEMQNATADQMKMLLTRLGMNSRMIVTGDVGQSDLPGGWRKSGLADIIRRVEDQDKKKKETKYVRFVRLKKVDVVRHKAVSSVLSMYESDTNNREEVNPLQKISTSRSSFSFSPLPSLANSNNEVDQIMEGHRNDDNSLENEAQKEGKEPMINGASMDVTSDDGENQASKANEDDDSDIVLHN